MKNALAKWNSLSKLVLLFWVVCLGEISAQVPPAPLAELYFSAYNPSMFEKGKMKGMSLKEVLEDPNMQNHPAYKRNQYLQKEREEKGFCFISIGCWGGPAPQSERQAIVRDHLVSYLENDILFSENGLEHTTAENVDRYSVHFILAAGDNFYPAGVESPESISFYTTFESFYRKNAVTPYFSTSIKNNKEERTLFTPWIVALGNHDAIQSSEAQVLYTYQSLENHVKLSNDWKNSEEQNEKSEGKDWNPTGRWYMPSNHFPIMVSDDTLVVVLDVPQLHRCAVFRSRQTQQGGENSSFEDADGRNKNIKATALDCQEAEEQKKNVKHWLTHQFVEVPFKVVMGHYPMKGNGPHSNYPFLVDWLHPLLNESCAVLYIHADNHYLQVSHDNLQYYANTGGGAGNNGKLHFPMERKSWHHPASVFQSIQGGFMIHCKFRNDEDGEQKFINYVIGEDGREQFSFKIDMAELQRCRQKHHLAENVVLRNPRKRHYVLRVLIRFALGSFVVLFGIRCALGYQRTFFSIGRINYLLNKIFSRPNGKRRACMPADNFSNSVIEDPVYVITSPTSESKDETVRIRLVEIVLGSSISLFGLLVIFFF